MGVPEHLTIDDIVADLAPLKRSYVVDRVMKLPDFPKPVLAFSQKTKLYARADYQAWKTKRKRKT